MKKSTHRVPVLLAAFFCAVLITFLATSDAAASNETDCVANGGSWNSADPTVGTCTYPPNSTVAFAQCGPNKQYTFTFFVGGGTQFVCTFVAPAASSSGESGGCRSEVRGPLEQVVTLAVCHGKNGAATFPIGACALKCSVSSALPAAAARKRPKNTVATIYVRTIGSGGADSNDPYTVCFDVGDLGLDPPIIFRYVDSSWTPVAIGNSASTVVCATGAGEGAFALGEPPKKE